MFIELVDALRCPVPHEESWLVAAAVRTEARHIVAGTLGCPVCAAEYPIRDGVADFRRDAPAVSHRSEIRADPETAMRIAALLDLRDARGFAVLLGEWGRHASALAGIVELPLLLVDPPDGMTGSPGISVIRTEGELLPLASGAVRATAVDGTDTRVLAAVRATKAGGRVIGFGSRTRPPGVKELARDADTWVGEREPDQSPLLTLHVRRAEP